MEECFVFTKDGERFMKKKIGILLMCLLVCLSLTGCWDAVELQKRAVVLMIGIDQNETGQGVNVSLQLARPQKFAPSSKEDTGSDSQNIVVVSRSGVEVTDAIRQIQLAIDRKLFFGHVHGLVIQESLARHGLLSIMDPLLQSRTVPREAWLFVSHHSAQEVLKQTPALDAIPSTYLANFFENRLLFKRPYEVTLGGFHQRFATPGIEPIAVWLDVEDKALSAPKIQGLAAFLGDKFVGKLNPGQSLGWEFVVNQFPRSPLTFSCASDQPNRFVIDIRNVKSVIRVSGYQTGVPQMRVRVELHGYVEGSNCILQQNQHELQTLKQRVAEELQTMVQTSLTQCQQTLETDILGTGLFVYRHNPHMWHGDKEWYTMFHRMKTSVHTEVHLDFLQTYRPTSL